MPFGPYSLCPDSDSRSIPSRCMSSGTQLAACTASVWNSTPCVWATRAISRTGCKVPTTLLAAMIDTSRVSRSISAATASGSTIPSDLTGAYVTLTPSRCASQAHVSRTAGCSIALVTMCTGWPANARVTPARARLSASVPLPVKTTPCGDAPTSSATCRRAFSTAARAVRPSTCKLDGFPKQSSRYGCSAARTRGSIGVVAALSK